MVPVSARANAFDPSSDPREAYVVRLLNAQPCAGELSRMLAQVTPTPLPSPSPTVPAAPLGPGQLYSTPFPRGTPVTTPPPIPTPTPQPSVTRGPTLLTRPTSRPTIAPAGATTPAPSPTPVGIPTLHPGYAAVAADKLTGNFNPGKPADAIGNVHFFYENGIIVGDRAHYDGTRYITITGNPYIVNNPETSILYADQITFDTIAQHAKLTNGRGASNQGVERGLVYYSAKDLQTDEHGVAHGDQANLTTCERPRAGYHITGRTIDVYPSDRIVISKALLWLGAAAVFYLPRVVIPLRRVQGAQRASYFPEIGYNSYQGLYVKARIGFGGDQYFTGHYTVEYYSKTGFALGYTVFATKRNGKRQTSLDMYANHDRRAQQTLLNVNVRDTENFSPTLRGQFGYAYNSNFGPLINLPPNRTVSASLFHMGQIAQQNYTYARSSVGSVSSQWNFGFTDTRTLRSLLQNNFSLNLSQSQTNYGRLFLNHSAGVNDLLHWANRTADYTLTFDKNYAATPFGINKEPELQVRPYAFLPGIGLPIRPTLTIGNYNEPATPLSTSRADLNLLMGPALYHFLGSDFSASLNVSQYAYGTGDLKASIQQNASLNTAIGKHISNAITYNETNYNGPSALPFSTLDIQPSFNYKSAGDVVRFFNSDYYNLSLNFLTNFNRQAQPVSYQLAVRPSRRSYVGLTGVYVPGPGLGFNQSQLQFATPVGRASTLQFLGFIDWKLHARITNKNIYYSTIIGECYEIQVQYNEAAKQINVSLSLLAFPSRAANFGITTSGQIIPGSFNGIY